jgi:pyrimidine operon attenuation protein/uracil phosphoribosyltransferase
MNSIFHNTTIQDFLKKLALTIVQENKHQNQVAIVGLQPRGVFFSERLFAEIQALNPTTIYKHGKLDITFFRDDIRKELHKATSTEIDFDVEEKKVILCDDVLYTGRTIRAGLDALLSFGRPKKVELCVLIDRKNSRELPIQPNYVGVEVDAYTDKKVKVTWMNNECQVFVD